jgi:hypothetical protein
MAITGDGSQEHPYEVHSYDELKTACNHSGVWIELANDIDCNDYGEDFEWQTVSLGNSSDLDLKTHTIKNFKVKDNNYCFHNNNWSKVHNGKILNVYLARSYGFSASWNSTESRWAYLENLSISINTGGGLSSSEVFDSFAMNACAIYIEGDANMHLIYPYNADGAEITNTDFLLDVDNINTGECSVFNGYGRRVKNCRIRGRYNMTTTQANYRKLYNNGGFDNCVIDLTTNAASVSANTSTGIINTDKTSSGSSISSMTAVDSTEIISGAALRAKNFDVINVVG